MKQKTSIMFFLFLVYLNVTMRAHELNMLMNRTEPNCLKCFHCSAYDSGAARPIEYTHKRIECEINEREHSDDPSDNHISDDNPLTKLNASKCCSSFFQSHSQFYSLPVWSPCPLSTHVSVSYFVSHSHVFVFSFLGSPILFALRT